LEKLLSLFWGSSSALDIRLLVALSLQQSPANSSVCDCAELGLCLLQRIDPHKQSVETALGLGGMANAFMLAQWKELAGNLSRLVLGIAESVLF
jgi:hypothetical protein